ncbi:tyrosine phosphatase family-domain-containing protein [Suillus ampliporus]|nr:tyrosine phosphatase family-domain-containing protein [Suillus ampliporus]
MTATDSGLEPLDPAYVADVLSRPPFVQIPGVCNVRDLGSYPTANPNVITKPGYAYRSAELSSITEEGARKLVSLGILTVFDLRSDPEMRKYSSPIPNIDDVEVIPTPVFKSEDYSPEKLAERFELYATGTTDAFMILYSQILEHGGPAFGAILRHVRDKPNSPFIFHCTAGKDRTGIMAAILLKLVGVDNHFISQDYSLTRVLARLSKEPLFAANSEAAMRMLTSRYETMRAFFNLLEEKYGGVEMYTKTLETIRLNLVVPAKSRM